MLTQASQHQLSRRMLLKMLAFSTLGLATSCAPLPGENLQQTDVSQARRAMMFTPCIYYQPAATPEIARLIEQVVEAYIAIHPETSITLIPWTFPSESDYRSWLTTRMIAGEAPEIAWEHYYQRATQTAKGWWLALDDYLAQPNPYIPAQQAGGARWLDSVPEAIWEQTRSPDGKQYQISLDIAETGLYYNKTLFERAGISTAWTRWEEFLSALDQLKTAGHEPFGIYTTAQWSTFQWADDLLLTSTWADRVPSLYAPERSQTGWRTVSTEEFARAILDGRFSAEDIRYATYLQLLKQWSAYWVTGFSAIKNQEELLQLFVSEKVAVVWLGTWHNRSIRKSARFDVGITYFPPLTTSSNPFAVHSSSYRVGGPGAAGYGIMSTARTNGLEDLAVDFLRFWSTPDHFGQIATKLGFYLPTLRGVEAAADLADFLPITQLPARAFFDPVGRLTAVEGEVYNRTLQRFLLNELSVEATQAEVQASLLRGAQALCVEQRWDWCR
jgi:ABC-type glycerol-3-phosphate transport system substrate-binding protein